MALFISNISALQFLISNGSPQRRVLGAMAHINLEETKAKPQPGTVPPASIIAELGIPEGIHTEKLHVNVADRSDRSKSQLIHSHVWHGPARNTYYRIDNDYYVQTPEAAFVHMATCLPLGQLVELGMLLCGTYAPGAQGAPTRYNMVPLTTKRKLSRYLNKCTGLHGISNARKAINYIQDASASPMESKIAVALSLPTRLGGYGIPAQLNAEIALTPEAKGTGYRDVRKPDFLWANQSMSMDFDSREYHDYRELADADESRRNELSAMGLNCIVARSKDFATFWAYLNFMEQVLSGLGKTRKSTTKDLREKRIALYRQLFGEDRWNPLDAR